MFGVEVTLASGNKASGVIFPDGQVYVHEPLADCYGSVSDLLEAETISNFQVLGPVVPLEAAKRETHKCYLESIKQFDKARQRVEEEYKASIAMLEEYHALSCTDDSTRENK